LTASFLEIENLTKNFGGLRAVNNVSFRIDRDEIVGLIGPNGAGKTTILRLITAILSPTAGTVRFKGTEITSRPIWEIVNMGLVSTFQVVKPFRNLPVFTNVMGALRNSAGIPPPLPWGCSTRACRSSG